MANKEKPVSVGNVGALVNQIPGLAVMAYNPLGDLEDVKARAGSFKNAGEGWNTFTFPDSFDSPPTVYCQCDGYNVEVKTVTAKSFLYRVVSTTPSAGSISTTTATFYSGANTRLASTAGSSGMKFISTATTGLSSTTTHKLVTGVTLTAGVLDTVSSAVTVSYLAISYGGD